MQKTADGLEDLGNRLEGWLTDIENKVSGGNGRPDTMLPPFDNFNRIASRLNDTESKLMEKISRTESLVKSEANNLKDVTNAQTGTTQALLTEVNAIESRR